MSTWPPKQDYYFRHNRPEAVVHYPAQPAYDVTVPAFETGYIGSKYAFYDTELYDYESNSHQLVMFQRQLGQSMASFKFGYGGKEAWQTNLVQPSQLPQPHQFSLFGIAADYPISKYPVTELGGSSGTLGFTALRDGHLRFAHAASRHCFECKLRDLPTLEEAQSRPIPDWFVSKAHEVLENVVCGHIGIQGKKVFPALPEQWTPEKDFRHIQPGESFQAVLTWEKKIPVICPVKISLYGILWYPQ